MDVSEIWEIAYGLVARKDHIEASEVASFTGRLLEDRDRLGPGDRALFAQYSLVLGYLLYHYDLRLDGADCEKMLIDALAADDSLQLAELYLGYYCFDRARFSDAAAHLSRCIPGSFKRWVGLKVSELLICCHLMLWDLEDPQTRDRILDEIRNWLSELVASPTEDVPMPSEFAKCLGQEGWRLGDDAVSIVKNRFRELLKLNGINSIYI